MKKLLAAAAIAATIAMPLQATAQSPSQANYACTEAASETLSARTPKATRNRIITACRTAFADKSFWKNPEAACDRQTRKFKADLRAAVSYTCMTAVALHTGHL
jgi:hypothetical protein